MTMARNSMSTILAGWGLLWTAGVDPANPVVAAPFAFALAVAVKFYVESVRRRR